MARAAGAKTWLLLGWARRAGDPLNHPGDSFAAMQGRLSEGYMDAARAIDLPILPVGQVWQRMRETAPELELWQSDGSLPSRLGSYLAACVLFRVLYHRSPVGNAYLAGLPEAHARRIQRAAAEARTLYAVGGR
jgi:hypothetical protein